MRIPPDEGIRDPGRMRRRPLAVHWVIGLLVATWGLLRLTRVIGPGAWNPDLEVSPVGPWALIVLGIGLPVLISLKRKRESR